MARRQLPRTRRNPEDVMLILVNGKAVVWAADTYAAASQSEDPAERAAVTPLPDFGVLGPRLSSMSQAYGGPALAPEQVVAVVETLRQRVVFAQRAGGGSAQFLGTPGRKRPNAAPLAMLSPSVGLLAVGALDTGGGYDLLPFTDEAVSGVLRAWLGAGAPQRVVLVGPEAGIEAVGAFVNRPAFREKLFDRLKRVARAARGGANPEARGLLGLSADATIDQVTGRTAQLADRIARMSFHVVSKAGDYWGSPAPLRAVATWRLLARRQLSDAPNKARGAYDRLQRRQGPLPPFSAIPMSEERRAFWADYTVERLSQLDEKELRKVSSRAWRESQPTKTPFVEAELPILPSRGMPRILRAVVFTVYGVLTREAVAVMQARGPRDRAAAGYARQKPSPIPEYGVFYQRELTAEQLAYVTLKQRQGRDFSPLAGLTKWLVQESGLGALTAQQGQTRIPAPFTIVASVEVDEQAALSANALPEFNLPKPFSLGRGVGLVLGQVPLPRAEKSQWPDLEAIADVTTGGLGLPIDRVSKLDVKVLATYVGQVDWNARKRVLIPLVGSDWQVANLFRPTLIKETPAFRRAFDKARSASTKRPASPATLMARTYYRVIKEGVASLRGSSSVDGGGREAFAAVGGSKGMRTDAIRSQWGTSAPPIFSSIFRFARRICEATNVCNIRVGGRRTHVATLAAPDQQPLSFRDLAGPRTAELRKAVLAGKARQFGLSPERAAQLGVEVGKTYLVEVGRQPFRAEARAYQGKVVLAFSPVERKALSEGEKVYQLMSKYGIAFPDESAKDRKRALTELRNKLMDVREELTSSYRHTASIGRLKEAMDGGEPYMEEMLDELALPNPLDDRDAGAAARYIAKGKLPEDYDLDASFRGLGPHDTWELDEAKLGAVFPQRGKQGTWAPEERMHALTGSNLVSRVGRAPVQEQAVAAALRGEMPFSDEAALAYLMEQAGLSLDEARQVLAAQKASAHYAQDRSTLQPSSALCKIYRSRKLKYRLPKAVMDAAGPESVVVWMSPKGDPRPRVMSWRRGTHIDCDMVGKRPEDMTELLAKSIQSALYWLAEKKPSRRKSNASVYVGRVGDPYLYLAYRAGQPVSLAVVGSNLTQANAGAPGFRIPAGVEPARELERYATAMAQLPRHRVYEVPAGIAPEAVPAAPPAPEGPPKPVRRPKPPEPAGGLDPWGLDLGSAGETQAPDMEPRLALGDEDF